VGRPEGRAGFESVAAFFAGRRVGHAIRWKEKTVSTMDDARSGAREGAPEGLVSGADGQTAGRGRHGRSWLGSSGDDLLVSILFRPSPASSSQLSMLAGLACARTVDRLLPIPSAIKWPNDVRVQGRKICGVLVESETSGVQTVSVVGIGLNVNLDPTRWSEIAESSTSLRQLTGAPHDRVATLRILLEEINDLYDRVVAGASVRDDWASRVETVGRTVTVTSTGDVVTGRAEGIDYDGSLLVRTADGQLRRFTAGEVTLQGAR